jgi:hypothetical protein
VSGSVGTFFYVRAMDNLMRSLQSRLLNSAALLSQTIDAADLHGIQSADDRGQAAYLDALEKVRRVRRTNPDIAFLYVMRRADDGTVQFVVDSDETEAQAVPGQVYDDVVPEMLEGFHLPVVDKDLYEDEWGVFLSGYAPLRNGEGRYLVGIDMRADEVRSNLRELHGGEAVGRAHVEQGRRGRDGDEPAPRGEGGEDLRLDGDGFAGGDGGDERARQQVERPR